MPQFFHTENNSLPPFCLKIKSDNWPYDNLFPAETEWYKWFCENGGKVLGTNILVFPDRDTKLLFLLMFQNSRKGK